MEHPSGQGRSRYLPMGFGGEFNLPMVFRASLAIPSGPVAADRSGGALAPVRRGVGGNLSRPYLIY